ncbi:hypothetical protein F511_27429 [Dorcoceras hygrometricum]|uniref:Uncharacterized protein n=1 Tax=Dorcoceras hygrometricum TaxID=472368 RepID=A0A2Z7AX82_9LAMI|nr:hypothetical protein F511_27429 [Dorcoceras hygrometricum]
MKLAAIQIFPTIPNPRISAAAATRHRSNLFAAGYPFEVKAHKSSAATKYYDDNGIPVEDVKTLVKFKSRHNYIRVLQVSRTADHPLAGSRLLLLDSPGNIHSIYYPYKSITNAYFDVFAMMPPIVPPGPLAILGFGAGSAAKLVLEMHPNAVIHGWELDPSVISVAREYFGLEKLEKEHPDRLYIHTGNALNASTKDGFSGIFVDLFSKGCVIPRLADPSTWERLKRALRKGGRVMANVGGRCVEPEDIRKDGGVIMVETLKAMHQVFGDELFVLNLNDREDESSLALTGKLPDANEWKKALEKPLRFYVDLWKGYDGILAAEQELKFPWK